MQSIINHFSHFLDMVHERNALVENVYPRLREYAREKYGLEFQVGFFLIQLSSPA